ncbi:MAG: class I adenylate-forming enzyme family protein [Microthrixaceae bacterium]
MLLHHAVEQGAAAAGDTVALVAGDQRWTFADLADRVARLASGLAGAVGPGERVVVVADNHPDFVALLSAVPRAGAVLAMGNTRHTPSELVQLVQACGAAAVVASEPHLAALRDRAGELPTVQRWWAIDGLDELADGPVEPARPSADTDVAWLIHTSGTTGRPKGAMLTHRSLWAAVLNTTAARPVAEDEVYLFPFPLFHVAAYNVLQHHLYRRPVVLLPRFDADQLLAAVADEAVTSMSLAPTMLAMLLDHPGGPSALAGVRRISYGAAPMPLDLLRRTLAALPAVGLAQGYGMTELSGNAVFLGPEEHRAAAADRPDLLTAAGRPGPLVALRTVDDDGTDVPPGTPGEIVVRGDQVCAGYWEDPAATAASHLVGADGSVWLRTGDVGRIDADGYLHVVDRTKDLIITGGENVASREVEDVVSEHPAVAAVAAVGVPDERWGERVCVAVVWSDGDGVDHEELIAWTEGRLAGFKRPRLVVALDELPVNASGKVEKRRVRDLVADHLTTRRRD